MSNGQATNISLDPMVQPFVDFWASYIKQANENTRQWVENVDGAADAKSWQRRWSEAMSRSMDAYSAEPDVPAGDETEHRILVKANGKPTI